MWHKAWLDTRWRFLIGLGLFILLSMGTVMGYPMVARRLPILFRHEFLNLVVRNRAVTVAIHTDIERKRFGIVLEIPMRMTVKAPSAVMGGIPRSQSIVE